MHARMTVAHARPEQFDEAISAVQEAFIPAARQQPGYGGFLLLTDPTTHQLIGISFWESEGDMQASSGNGGYYAERMERFIELLTEPATTTTHEVTVREP